MSYPRPSVNDYPEHLNPFYEGEQKSKFWKIGRVRRSSSFGETLRNTLLFKSFRGKKKKPQLDTPSSPPERRRYEPRMETQYRQTLPTIVSPSPSPSRVSVPPVLLPRSRFSERVSKSNLQDQVESVSKENIAVNPFEKDEVTKNESRLKRRKRRAPLPPNSVLNGTLSVSSTNNSSKWSLTSEDTDISMHLDNQHLTTNGIDQSVSLNISSIVKEIEKFTGQDDTKEKCTETDANDIPDILYSSIDVQCKDDGQTTDESCNMFSENCDKDDVEDKCPDVLYNANCIALKQDSIDSNENDDSCRSTDSLKILIDSMELNNNDNKLQYKVDSLTNIINSINMVENECYEPPVVTAEISKTEEILNADVDKLNVKDEDERFEESATKKNEKRTPKPELTDDIVIV